MIQIRAVVWAGKAMMRGTDEAASAQSPARHPSVKRRAWSRKKLLMSGKIVATVATLPLAAGACERQVRLVSLDGEVELTYACADFASQGTSALTRTTVDDYAIRIVRYANEADGMDAVMPLLEAADREDVEAIEKFVVRHLCSGGGIWARETVVWTGQPVFPDRGSEAPSFALPLLSVRSDTAKDSIVRLENHTGDIVLLYLWSTWCGPCRGKHPEMVSLTRDYGGRGVAVYGVLHRDRVGAARRWLEELGAYPVLLDAELEVARRYGVWGIPRMYLIGPDGRMIGSCIGCQWGAWSPDSLRLRLDSLISTLGNG